MKPVAFGPRPFSLVGVDIKTLPKSGFFEHILVAVDYFTKFVIVAPLKSMTGEEVTNALVKHIFLKHGSPEMMLSDNGGCYRAEIEAAVLKHFNVKPRFTSPNHPQSNGLCERTNGVIAMVLGKLMASGEYGAASPENDCVEDWPDKLDEAAFVYNTKPHSTTKKTPYKVLYGIKCNTWVSESLKKAEKKGDGENITAKNLFNEEEELAHQDELDARRQEIRKGVQKPQEEATARYILSYKKRHHVGETKLVVGDKVMKTDMQK